MQRWGHRFLEEHLMWRKLLVVAVCLSFPAAALAHLCNDVFVQARDNLAVKVDVRDGQLRIGKQATFRVYLLNTMDRAIAKIALEVRTNNKFQTKVKPGPGWRRYPALRCVRRGGKKQFFEVTLTRRPGVPDGKYKIDLHLYNPRRKNQVFKTVDLGEAAGVLEVPKAGKVKVDGSAGAAEWGSGLLCKDFYYYAKKKRYFSNVLARNQTRVRVLADKGNVYLHVNFQGGAGAKSDVADIYLADGVDASPLKISVERTTGKVTCEKGTTGIECKLGGGKSDFEIKIPRSLAGLSKSKVFRANFTRTTSVGGKSAVTYWRGNKYSVKDPIVFGQFKLPN
jgi:hypothetical protein